MCEGYMFWQTLTIFSKASKVTRHSYFLTLSVPVSYQQPTSPYITHTKYDIW